MLAAMTVWARILLALVVVSGISLVALRVLRPDLIVGQDSRFWAPAGFAMLLTFFLAELKGFSLGVGSMSRIIAIWTWSSIWILLDMALGTRVFAASILSADQWWFMLVPGAAVFYWVYQLHQYFRGSVNRKVENNAPLATRRSPARRVSPKMLEVKVKKHRPNFISLRIRVLLLICALFLMVFALAEVALGYTYLPGKRGGFFLSGIPTLMLAAAATVLLAAVVLTIVDHYDKRPNEVAYKAAKSACYKVSLFLFLGAPFFELTERLLNLAGYSPFPSFHGIASQYSLHSPEFKNYAKYLAPIENQAPIIVVGSVLSLLIGFVVDKFFANRFRRFSLLLLGLGMMGMSLLWVVNATRDLMVGEVRYRTNHIVYSEAEPAKFNAILLTHFSLSGFMLLMSGFVVVGLVTNRIKPL